MSRGRGRTSTAGASAPDRVDDVSLASCAVRSLPSLLSSSVVRVPMGPGASAALPWRGTASNDGGIRRSTMQYEVTGLEAAGKQKNTKKNTMARMPMELARRGTAAQEPGKKYDQSDNLKCWGLATQECQGPSLWGTPDGKRTRKQKETTLNK